MGCEVGLLRESLALLLLLCGELHLEADAHPGRRLGSTSVCKLDPETPVSACKVSSMLHNRAVLPSSFPQRLSCASAAFVVPGMKSLGLKGWQGGFKAPDQAFVGENPSPLQPITSSPSVSLFPLQCRLHPRFLTARSDKDWEIGSSL